MFNDDEQSCEAQDGEGKNPEHRKGPDRTEPKSFQKWSKIFLWFIGGLLAIAQLINEIIEILKLFP